MSVERYREVQRHGGLVDLASRLKLLFQGGDRLRYLNGQVTANLLSAPNPGVLPACITTAKGKLSADAFVTLGPASILIDADPSLSETLPLRMERYIVADDVTKDDVTSSVGIIHCLGVDGQKLEGVVEQTPLPVRRFGLPGFDLSQLSEAEMHSVWSKLAADIPVLDEELLEVIRIERGVPRWGCELHEDTLPPEAGLERTHIDYAKGCYIGQEVISRLKSVGHVNRRLVGFISQNDVPFEKGADVRSFAAPEKSLGTITSATRSFALEKEIALGYLRRSASVDGLFVASPGSEPVPITVCDLPFIP